MPVRKIAKVKTLLSAIFDFLLFLQSAQIHSLILNFKKRKWTNKNTQNVIYKIKSYFPQPFQGARDTTLLYF